jgi:hypothetical protein
MIRHLVTTPWGSITEWIPTPFAPDMTKVAATSDWRLELEILKLPWIHPRTLVDLSTKGLFADSHLLKIQTGPHRSIQVFFDRQVENDTGENPPFGEFASPKLFQWEENQEVDDSIRIVIFKQGKILGARRPARLADNERTISVRMGDLVPILGNHFDIQLESVFNWAILETKWCRTPSLDAQWLWPLNSMRPHRCAFRLEPAGGGRVVRVIDEDDGLCMLIFPIFTLTFLDFRVVLMRLRPEVYGRPLAIIKEGAIGDADDGNAYDVAMCGQEWHRLISFASRNEEMGPLIKYHILLFPEMGHLSPYQCLQCDQEVPTPGGTCGDCTVLQASMNIRDF